MTIFDVFTLIGGLAMFLFGMSVMGNALEKSAGNRLKTVLSSMTTNLWKGFILGLGVTAIIQSSSATTVMVVGFVNSGLMTLKQTVGIILGSNLGAALTSWILSLTGIQSGNFFIQLLKPSSFVPILALIGIILFLFQKDDKRKNIGAILLGFAVLMFGMETMSSAVEGLKDVPEFTRILTLFSNPILGVLVGTAFTVIIQSSGASIGVLQALTVTGSVTYATAVPVLMGQNIGTCISAVLSSIGASKDAKRAAAVHVIFNVLSTAIVLPLYYIGEKLFLSNFAASAATPLGIALVNTVYKIVSLIILMPFSRYLVNLAQLVLPESAKEKNEKTLLDERLLATPAVALAQSRSVTMMMAELAVASVKKAFGALTDYNEKLAKEIREEEGQVDMYEDKLGSYLVKLSGRPMTDEDSQETNKLLHVIGDFERISDHAVNIIESCEEIKDKNLAFSVEAKKELDAMVGAVSEALDLSLIAFRENDLQSAALVEPLEQVVDSLKALMKKQHIARLQKQECTIELGFVLTDLMTNLERISDHCSNIAGCILEMEHNGMDIHEYLHGVKHDAENNFQKNYEMFKKKYDPLAQ